MKHEELAFFNQQLAGMLRSGIPLERALRQLCREARPGGLRREMEALAQDLSEGRSLDEALASRQLPSFHSGMLRIGARSGDLPGVLTAVADYYQRVHLTKLRLSSLMVYPSTVLLLALLVSLLLAVAFPFFLEDTAMALAEDSGAALMKGIEIYLWMPVVVIALVSLSIWGVFFVPALWRRARWRLPGFAEAGLANVASAMAVLLKGGAPLPESVRLVRELERSGPAAEELKLWEECLASGDGSLASMAGERRACFPPLFYWLVAQSGENLERGFVRVAEVYQTRANHRTDAILFGVVPVSILFLGALLVTQAVPLFRVLSGAWRWAEMFGL